MGLDITAYRQLSPVAGSEHLSDDDAYDAGYMRAYDNPSFPGRVEGCPSGWLSSAEDNRFAFRAGSYSSYNRWREELAKLAGYPALENPDYRTYPTHSSGAWATESGPFWELINFADNEGTIGPVVAAKLVEDFATFAERAEALGDGDSGDFFDMYKLWQRAFEMAADGGAVDFH